MFNLFKTIGIALTLSAWNLPAQASDHHSPRTASLGGAGHAGPMLNDSVFLNPSFISFLPTYSVEANYLFYNDAAAPAPLAHGREYSIAVQDGRNDLFQAGAAYTQREDGTFVHIGAAKSLIKELGFGIGGKYFFNDATLPSGKDMNLSTTWIVFPELQAAFIADNLLQTSEGKQRGLFREYTLGLKYNLKSIVLLYFDPHYTPDFGSIRYGYESGVELVVFNDILVRAGMLRNATVPWAHVRGRAYGFGLGWIGPRITLDYAFQRMLAPYTAVAHSFGFTIFF